MKEMNEEMKRFLDQLPREESRCGPFDCDETCPMYLKHEYPSRGDLYHCAEIIVINIAKELELHQEEGTKEESFCSRCGQRLPI